MEHSRATEWDLAVVGLGYVGLPLVREATRSGLRVVGIDTDPARVDRLGSGISHIAGVPDAEIASLLAHGFHATTDPGPIAAADTVVICVPTPLAGDRRPDLSLVTSAAATVADRLSTGTLVVLESTTWPGATEEVVRPLLEKSGLVAGTGFHLAYSPERIDPGNPAFGLRNTPKIVAGLTPACLDRATSFYGKFVDEVVPVSGPRVAETAKLLENTYRQVNIALVNEMAMFCESLGVDIWETISAAATKPFGYQAFRPGPGVGGHCIPVDPAYLAHRVRELGQRFRLTELAQRINDRMPGYVTDRAIRLLNRHGRSARGAAVVLLGVTYKPDIADGRGSPAAPIASGLRAAGAMVGYVDPLVEEWIADGIPVRRLRDLGDALTTADLVVLLQPHRCFDLELIAAGARLLLDTRGVLPAADNIERL